MLGAVVVHDRGEGLVRFLAARRVEQFDIADHLPADDPLLLVLGEPSPRLHLVQILLHHFMNEPVLAGEVCPGVVVEEAGSVKIHAAVRRHAAILRLERQVTPAEDAHVRVIDGVAEQQRCHGDFACGEGAPALRMQAANRYGTYRFFCKVKRLGKLNLDCSDTVLNSSFESMTASKTPFIKSVAADHYRPVSSSCRFHEAVVQRSRQATTRWRRQ